MSYDWEIPSELTLFFQDKNLFQISSHYQAKVFLKYIVTKNFGSIVIWDLKQIYLFWNFSVRWHYFGFTLQFFFFIIYLSAVSPAKFY